MAGAKKEQSLTHTRLLALLRYDPEAGIFISLVRRGSLKVGSPAGTFIDNKGYITIGIDCKKFLTHRVAWFYVHGHWPKQLDHRDLNKANNRLANLREASNGQNTANRGLQRNNTSGFKGAFWSKWEGKWVSSIHANGKRHFLGYFATPEAAHAAYVAAAQKFFGEFARAA